MDPRIREDDETSGDNMDICIVCKIAAKQIPVLGVITVAGPRAAAEAGWPVAE
jgi:hypothetical protein